MSQAATNNICAKCHNPAGLFCPRCFDSYCSFECQKTDWPYHRTICFKMPQLVTSLSSLGVLEKTSSFSLAVTTPRAVNIIQGQPKSPKKSVTKAPTPVEPPKKPDAPIEEVRKDPKVVQGEAKIFQKPTPPQRLEIPKPVDRPTQDQPKTNVVDKTQFPVSTTVDPPKVTYVAQKTPEVVPQTVEEPPKPVKPKMPTIMRTGMKPMQPLEKKPTETPLQQMIKDLVAREWPKTKDIQVKLISVIEGNIIALIEDNEEVGAYHDYIAEEIEKVCGDKKVADKDYQPITGEVVLAFFEDCWYRAQVMTADGPKVKVHYIDYGNYEDIAPNQMMPIPLKMKFDVLVRCFVVDNMPDDPENLTENQIEILSAGMFKISNVQQVDGLWHCKILNF